MLPFEVVQEVKDDVEAQVAIDRHELDSLRTCTRGLIRAGWLSTILQYGAEDRELINQAIAEGNISQSRCYENCHQCCSMNTTYDVETFDILLSYKFNPDAVRTAYRFGKLGTDREWCGLLEDGLCSIHRYKPYTCLLTLPSPKGAEKGGCYFRGEGNAQTLVHKITMVVTGRMRRLFKEYLPELPEFVGSNINQAFRWAVHMADEIQR